MHLSMSFLRSSLSVSWTKFDWRRRQRWCSNCLKVSWWDCSREGGDGKDLESRKSGEERRGEERRGEGRRGEGRRGEGRRGRGEGEERERRRGEERGGEERGGVGEGRGEESFKQLDKILTWTLMSERASGDRKKSEITRGIVSLTYWRSSERRCSGLSGLTTYSKTP